MSVLHSVYTLKDLRYFGIIHGWVIRSVDDEIQFYRKGRKKQGIHSAPKSLGFQAIVEAIRGEYYQDFEEALLEELKDDGRLLPYAQTLEMFVSCYGGRWYTYMLDMLLNDRNYFHSDFKRHWPDDDMIGRRKSLMRRMRNDSSLKTFERLARIHKKIDR